MICAARSQAARPSASCGRAPSVPVRYAGGRGGGAYAGADLDGRSAVQLAADGLGSLEWGLEGLEVAELFAVVAGLWMRWVSLLIVSRCAREMSLCSARSTRRLSDWVSRLSCVLSVSARRPRIAVACSCSSSWWSSPVSAAVSARRRLAAWAAMSVAVLLACERAHRARERGERVVLGGGGVLEFVGGEVVGQLVGGEGVEADVVGVAGELGVGLLLVGALVGQDVGALPGGALGARGRGGVGVLEEGAAVGSPAGDIGVGQCDLGAGVGTQLQHAVVVVLDCGGGAVGDLEEGRLRPQMTRSPAAKARPSTSTRSWPSSPWKRSWARARWLRSRSSLRERTTITPRPPSACWSHSQSRTRRSRVCSPVAPATTRPDAERAWRA